MVREISVRRMYKGALVRERVERKEGDRVSPKFGPEISSLRSSSAGRLFLLLSGRIFNFFSFRNATEKECVSIFGVYAGESCWVAKSSCFYRESRWRNRGRGCTLCRRLYIYEVRIFFFFLSSLSYIILQKISKYRYIVEYISEWEKKERKMCALDTHSSVRGIT